MFVYVTVVFTTVHSWQIEFLRW